VSKTLIGMLTVLMVCVAVAFAWHMHRATRFQKPMIESHELMESFRYAEARAILEPIANEYWAAKYELALLYAGGLGVEADQEKAISFLENLIEMKKNENHPRRCAHEISDLAMEIEWIAVDLEKLNASRAREWHRLAKERGFDQTKCK